MRWFLPLVLLALLPACDTPTHAPEPEEEPPVDNSAKPRAFTFERVMIPTDNFGQIVALDLDETGRSAFLAKRSASTYQLWRDNGSGWTQLWQTDVGGPSCVALEPGGSRIFVGMARARYHIFEDDGTRIANNGVLDGIATIPPGQVVTDYHIRQCEWYEGSLYVTLAHPEGTKGAVLSQTMPANLDTRRPLSQVLSNLRYSDATSSCKQGFAAHALRVDRFAGRVRLGVGVTCGSNPASLAQATASGAPGAYDGWSASPLHPDLAYLRRPLVYGGYEGKGTTTVYSFNDFATAESVVTVSGPTGTFGEAPIIEATHVTRYARTADIAADGRLWIGASNGLFRSIEVVR